MLKAKVKDFVHMIGIGTMIQEDPFTKELIDTEEYARRHGEECVIGFWVVDKNVLGVYTNSEEKFDYWNNMLKEGEHND